MTKDQLKNFITTNILTKTGKLNTNRTKRGKKFVEANIECYEALEKHTNYLPKDTSYNQRIYHLINDIDGLYLCPHCKVGEPRFYGFSTGYSKYCSYECARNADETVKKMKEANLKIDKDGLTPRQRSAKKSKETFKERYGVDNISKTEWFRESQRNIMNSEEGKRRSLKAADTKEQRYGYRGSPRDKVEATMVERYGVKSPFQMDNIRKLTVEEKQKCIDAQKRKYYHKCKGEYDKLHFDILTDEDTFVNERTNIVDLQCTKCNHEFRTWIKLNGAFPNCPSCTPKSFNRSKVESEIVECVGETCVETNSMTVTKFLDGITFEVDLLYPRHNLAVEYNGMMWHSFGKSKYTKFDNHMNEKTNKTYHLNKTEICEEQGIQLFHIFENEWLDAYKRDIWISMIKNKLGMSDKIYARKTSVRGVDITEAKKFLNENHIQGHVNASVYIGLYQEEDLISIMTFGKSRYDKNVEWELYRFATKKYHHIVGGASKLLKYFERHYAPKSLLSYANRRLSKGDLYYALGFEFVENTVPNYFYFHESNTCELMGRQMFQKHKLASTLKHYDKTKSETENMYANGYRKIYDCGNMKFVKVYNEE